ncbi:MAG: efflux RND transporter permease subunit [Pseudomonadota bacterium]
MNLIRGAIERPIAVIAAVLMAVLFGAVALTSIPIQLTPDVQRPIITIETDWAGAAPIEVEREILNQQEDALSGLEGLEKITGTASDGQAEIELEFGVGTDMNRALLLVANRLDQVKSYPEEADQPTLSTAGAEDSPIAWFTMSRVPGNERSIHSYGTFANDVFRDRIERVPGVGRVDVFGGSEPELRVTIRPEQLARYGLTVPEVADALRVASVAMTAGDVDEGKRRYVVRVEGELQTPDQVGAVVLRTVTDPDTGRLARVTVGDIADVAYTHKDPVATIRVLGEPALAARVIRQTGANVIETMAGIREAVAELEAGPFPAAGLTLTQRYDETIYIDSAIDLVLSNIYVGGTLAAIVLLLFLRSFGATLIVSVAIPVSVIASFVAMAAMGRSINVISLAGLAFAVGMVVDAAIVVLENIYRLRQSGLSRREAAYRGAAQVWGAVLVSALTTVMVFIPILTMQLEVGQLFRDIAVAISVAVMLSLLVAVTLIPAMSARLLGRADGSMTRIQIPVIDHVAMAFRGIVLGFTRRIVRNRMVAFAFATAVAVTCGGLAWTFMPKLDYLPTGNRNLVFGIIVPPPGYNLDTMTAIAETVEGATRPIWVSERPDDAPPTEQALIDSFFFVAFRGTTFIGASAEEGDRAGELIGPMSGPIFAEPGTFGFVRQPSLFGRGFGGGNSIDVDIQGPDLDQILGVALQATGLIGQALPRSEGHQLRPIPGLELGSPEVRLMPERTRLADAGVSTRAFGMSVDAFNDGLRVAEITVDGDRIDLTLQGPDEGADRTQGIGALPIVTDGGLILPASQLAAVDITAGPTEVRHLERQRTVSVVVSLAPGTPLETAMEVLQEQVIEPLRAQGLPEGVNIRLSGTADQLQRTFQALEINLLLALVIVYLVMAVLFESFLYPLIILISVPLAAAGGIAGLATLNGYLGSMTPAMFQPLDMLTMLGFVILIGIVVNNAILLVDQTLFHVREDGMTPVDAIMEATDNRLRPIFMSTITSVAGMLPLVLFPGAGSELYRGLGSVVVGGLSLSALLTLLLIPPLLSCFLFERRSAPPSSAGSDAPVDGPVPLGGPRPEPVAAE